MQCTLWSAVSLQCTLQWYSPFHDTLCHAVHLQYLWSVHCKGTAESECISEPSTGTWSRLGNLPCDEVLEGKSGRKQRVKVGSWYREIMHSLLHILDDQCLYIKYWQQLLGPETNRAWYIPRKIWCFRKTAMHIAEQLKVSDNKGRWSKAVWWLWYIGS